MKQIQTSNYEKAPFIAVQHEHAIVGWSGVIEKLVQSAGQQEVKLVTIDCYQGVDLDAVIQQVRQLAPQVVIHDTRLIFFTEAAIGEMVEPFVTDHPVFGKMNDLTIQNFIDSEKLKALHNTLSTHTGIQFVIGPAAALVTRNTGITVYADMARWEIQLRFRKKLVSNLGANNATAPFAYLYRRSFFVDWRVLDKHKVDIFDTVNYWLDTTVTAEPKLVSHQAIQSGLQQALKQPFRVVPFFDPGPWGGQWLKEVCDLPDGPPNYAWAFDCVPEENSLLLKLENATVEIPSINLVHEYPEALLGKKVYDAFGASFPIRFDFLDTMDGGNLSLQVHPLKEYIREHFGMPFTQDESYYMMEVRDNAIVYLGLKDETDPKEMIDALESAYENATAFDADKYVAKWPVNKHDHFLIPSGTIHCSGTDSVVLEISATPYIFTFKLYDWERMGLDGKPRPISIEHGKKAIQWDRRIQYTKDHLINQFVTLNEGEGWKEERTGLYDNFFIETRRYWMNTITHHNTNGSVNVLNLVEGEEAIVESPHNAFEPYIIHYAETFIVPASVGDYTIRPYGKSEHQQIAVLKAFINTDHLKYFNLK
jgi:mannose-6-phosphate isomerase class I